MVNSDAIFDAIENIAAHPGKLDKQRLVAEMAEHSEFVQVCSLAYNPFKIFGIRPSNPAGVHGEGQFDYLTLELLDDLLTRKLTGNAARDAVCREFLRLTAKSQQLLWRIILKDLRAGFSESTINKAVKGLIPEFPYMRCTLPKDAKLDEFDWKLGVLSQEKADGMFANVDHEVGGLVRITSRQGTEFPIDLFAALTSEVKGRIKPGTQMHGELLVKKAGVICAREIGNGILNGVAKGSAFEEDEEPLYLVWDQIPLTAVIPKGKYEVTYLHRIFALACQLDETVGSSIAMIQTRTYHSLADAYGHYRDLLALGKEGTIIKNPHAIWKDGTSKEQVKLKLEADIDLKVVSIVPGKEGGKNEGRAGSMTCVTSCGGLQVDVTVKNEAMRDRIDANPSDWIDRVIVVRANSIMQPSESNELHSLFLPRMVETDYRIDKAEPDSLQRVRDQFASAISEV